MKLKNKIHTIIVLIILFIISLNTNIYATEIEKGEYSKRYEEWLELDEEERKNTIAPLPVNVRNTNNFNAMSSLFNMLKSTTIPQKYDLRDYIDVEVKDQMQTESCWAFSANTSLETYLALNNKTYNFSERHLEYNTAKNFINGTNPDALNRNIGDGGYPTTAFTYYSRGSGPILEEDMPFENNENPIKIDELPTKEPIQKVDNMVYLPNIYKRIENGNIIYEDASGEAYTTNEITQIRNQIKEHIMSYGGISVSVNANTTYLNTNTGAYNLDIDGIYANHAVTIIGWDDTYSKDNFLSEHKPTTDGAYIVLNSWGKNWGTTYGGSWKGNGIYYISYEDFLVETSMRGVTSVSDIEYDNLYQYDTSEMYGTINVKYAANVFTAEKNEKLTEVMIGTWTNQTCNVYINTKGDDLNINNLTKIANNVTLRPGYNTIEINSDINILKGNKFAIVVEIQDGTTCIGIENNCGYFSNATSNAEESYVSSNGTTWNDLYNLYNDMNLCIKAYTKTEEEIIELPEQVTGLKSNSQGYNNIALTWTAQSDVSGYELYRYNSSTNEYEKIVTTIDNSYTVSQLQEGTSYEFKVRAYKTINGTNYYGEYSSILTVSTNTRTDISKCTITGIKNKSYTGSKLTQSITVKYGSKTLVNGTDYTISYLNNQNTGKATVEITGIGDYKGTVTKTFIITPKQVTGFKVKSQTTSTINLTWSKATGVTGYSVYSFNYKKNKWEYVGTTSKTSYTIKKLKAGTTYRYRVRAYKTVDGTQYFGSYATSVKTATKTSTPKISKITSKSKKATIKWNKVSGASGYEIYMATSKNGKYSKIKTINKSSTVNYTKSSLKKNKTYYFKIRTYKTVDGKKIYSSYSSVKSIKIK